MIESEWIPCKTCGDPTTFLGTKLCNGCWEVQTRLQSYLNNEKAIQFVLKALNEAQVTPPDSQPNEPDKVKPLAQYLSEYIKQEIEDGGILLEKGMLYVHPSCSSWRELLGQALDAYQSTENVTIKIERV